MLIWLIQTGEALPLTAGVRKMRTGLLADVLLARGHTIHWWVSAFEHQRKLMQFEKDQEVKADNNLVYHVLKGCGYRKNISILRYADHRIIARKFRKFSNRSEKPDGIIASSPCHHLAYEAVRYSRKRNVPILIDVRDLWPDIFLDSMPKAIWQKIARLLLAQDFFRIKLLLRQSNGILAMSRGVLDWALNKAGRPIGEWDRVFYMGYKKGRGQSRKPLLFLSGREEQKLAVYIGTFGHSYELHLIIEAARILHESGNDKICFILAGTGDQELALRREARGLENVIITGWIDSNEIQELLSRAWVGIVPCRSVTGALPNKIFEYLSTGLPIISSLEGEMAEAIEKYSLGANYQAGDTQGLLRALIWFLENPRQRELMSENALSYFYEHGDAEKIYLRYAEHIENFIANHQKRKEICLNRQD